MLAAIQRSDDPFFNLALEDYLLHERGEDFLILSVNRPSLVIGKHQVPHVEVDAFAAEEDGVAILRRISGGGTVYHDHGNVNFAFIRQSEKGKQVDFTLYTKPVISYLEKAGIKAVFGGKNDILVDGVKISGNAEHVFRERVLHHGTILFDASFEKMRKYLRPISEKYSSRGVASNRTTVTNIKSQLTGINSSDELMGSMMDFFSDYFPGLIKFELKAEESEKVISLAKSKYQTWEWTWAYGPQYNFSSPAKILGTAHHVKFQVKDGIIWKSEITGSPEMEAAGKLLIGCRHMLTDIEVCFRKNNILVERDELRNFF